MKTELEREIQYKKRMAEKDFQAVQRQTADLSEVRDDLQQIVDNLAEKLSRLSIKSNLN